MAEKNKLPRSKLRGIKTNRESLAQLSPPHVSSGGPVRTSPGFPPKDGSVRSPVADPLQPEADPSSGGKSMRE